MTVQTNTTVATGIGNGVTSVFPIPFKFNRAEDLIVYLVIQETEEEIPLTLHSDYTVTGAGNENGGNLTMLAGPLPVGQSVVAQRIVDLRQLTDLRNQGRFFAEVHEDVFDKLVMIDQQQQTHLDRAMVVDLLWRWNALNRRIINVGDPIADKDATHKQYVDQGDNDSRAYADSRDAHWGARTLRTPDPIPSLPEPSGRARRLLSFDSMGRPVAVAPEPQSATELAMRLADPNEGAAMVGFEKGTVASGIVNARLTLLAKSIMGQAASLGLSKPDFRPQTIGELQRKWSQRYSFTSAAQVGDGQPGLVFGSFVNGVGAQQQAGIMLGAPFDVAGDYEMSVTVEPVHGSSLASLDVRAAVYNSWGNGGTRITDVAVSGSGTWTHTMSVSSAGSVFGPRILVPAGAGLFRVTAFSITTAGGKVYSSADVDFDSEMFVSFARSSAASGVVVGRTLTGLETRTSGVRNGKVPLCVYTAPNGVSDVNASLFQGHIRGVTPAYPTLPQQLLDQALSYYRNGYALPALIYAPGTYLNTVPLAYFRIVEDNPFDEYTTIYVGCPNGTAVLDTDGTNRTGFFVSPQDDTPRIAVRAANIETTPNIRAHWQSNNADFMAYRFKAVADSNTANGIRVDRGDMLLHECHASGADNDGFNHNVRGHSCLVDCIAENNTDDGFSPHVQCTYEVWGGEFRNNGKANLVPAFGAQGFCVGVESSGATGLSPRAGDYNYGGFVCLSNDSQFRMTTMFLINCTSNGDVVGAASAGGMSHLTLYGGEVGNSIKFDLVSHGWDSPASGASADRGGVIDRYNLDASGPILLVAGSEYKYTNIPGDFLR